MRFFQYFALDMRPTEAQHFHQQMILQEDSSAEILANAAKNPTLRQVTYLYECWRKENLGNHNPLSKIKEKIPLYEEKGVTVMIEENLPWAVLIVTPVMKRIHSLERAREVIFVDSTSSVENYQSTMTVMLTATKIGALPIAAFIHESQSTDGYIMAMMLLKKYFPHCFGGKEFPQVFMTDDSAAEKKALKTLWPSAQQLLCQFHVAQAEWRWLHGKSSSVPLDERRRLMRLFQAVMYADTEDTLEEACSKIQEESSEYPNFVARFDKLFTRRSEWISYDRQKLIVRRNNTNNYSEAMMRILKDVVLQRAKAYNITALTEYVSSTWEDILTTKLLDYAYERRKLSVGIFSHITKSLDRYTKEDVEHLASNMYSVPSSKSNEIRYIVDTSVGTCTCLSGIGGAFCKHQCFILQNFPIILPNSPLLTVAERYLFGKIALGDNCPPEQYFKSFKTNLEATLNNTEGMIIDVAAVPSTSFSNSEVAETAPKHNVKLNNEEYASETEVSKLKETLLELIPNKITKSLASKLTMSLQNALQKKQQINILHTFSQVLSAKDKRFKKIHVQPTSISRRRFGTSGGRARISAGRPVKLKEKRIRNLSYNIQRNQPNAKSHGSGH